MKRLLAYMTLGLAGSAPLHAAGPSPAAFDQQVAAEVGQLVRPGEPGLAVCVASDGAITSLVASGLADIERRVPLTVDTPVYIASVAKEFTAVAILKLVEEGRLSLDERAAERLPSLPAYMAPVTVRHLLTHTGGVPDYDDEFASRPGLTNADVMGFLNSKEALDAPAGSKWGYSNAGFVVLAELFGAVAGEPLDRYISRTFFAPLGMGSTFFIAAETLRRDRAVGYRKEGDTWVRDDYDALTVGPGGIYSSVRDLCTWGLALDAGKVLKRRTVMAAFTPAVDGRARPTPMGLGYQVEDIPEGPLQGEWYAAMFGQRDGFRAVQMRLKSHPFRYSQLGNSSRQLDPMRIPNLYFERQ